MSSRNEKARDGFPRGHSDSNVLSIRLRTGDVNVENEDCRKKTLADYPLSVIRCRHIPYKVHLSSGASLYIREATLPPRVEDLPLVVADFRDSPTQSLR